MLLLGTEVPPCPLLSLPLCCGVYQTQMPAKAFSQVCLTPEQFHNPAHAETANILTSQRKGIKEAREKDFSSPQQHQPRRTAEGVQ